MRVTGLLPVSDACACACAHHVIDDCEFLCVGVLGRARTCPGMCMCLCVRITWAMTLSDVCGWYVCVYGYEYVCVLVIVHGRYCQLSACVLVSMCARYCHATDQHSCVPTVRARACSELLGRVYVLMGAHHVIDDCE